MERVEDQIGTDGLEKSACRSLVVIGSAQPTQREERPAAGFLTQLIACRTRVPAYRRAVRAEPGVAAGSYRRPDLASPAKLDLRA